MSPRSRLLAAVTVPAAVLLVGSAAFADTTLRHRIAPAGGTGYQALTAVGGEKYVVRRGAGAKADRTRAAQRRSLAFFGQLTDPQIADEMSPARVDFLDPAGGEIKSSWRPQEAIGLQVFDQVVRNVNANRTSAVRDGQRQARRSSASRSPPATWPTTSSSTRRAGSRPCSTAGRSTRSPASRSARPTRARARRRRRRGAQRRRRRAPVHRRRRLRRLRAAPGRALRRLLGPGRGAAGRWPVRGVPALPGLAGARAAAVHRAPGSTCRGTSPAATTTGSIQGNAPASTDLFRAIATGCLKVFPTATLDPAAFSGADEDEAVPPRSATRRSSPTLLAGGRTVAARPGPPDHLQARVQGRDRRRARLPPRRGRRAHAPRDGNATYYSFRPRKGVRADLARHRRRGRRRERQPRRPAVPLARARAQGGAASADRLVVAYGHHTLGDDEQRPHGRGRGRLRAAPTSPAATPTRAARRRSTAATTGRRRRARCSCGTRTWSPTSPATRTTTAIDF